MNIIDPGIASLATAKSLLLDPWGLTESDMARALGEIFTHKVDYADLYFQYTRSEGWSLEEGIVKTGSFSISQGVGVRAVAGTKTAFAYSDALSGEALLSSARAVRSIARQGAGRIHVPADDGRIGSSLYPPVDPLTTLTAPEKVGLLERVEKMARAKDPHVIQVMASLGMEYDVIMVAGSDGRRTDLRARQVPCYATMECTGGPVQFDQPRPADQAFGADMAKTPAHHTQQCWFVFVCGGQRSSGYRER